MCVQYLGAVQEYRGVSNAGEAIPSGERVGSKTRARIRIDETPMIILRTEVLESRGTEIYCLIIGGFWLTHRT